MTLLTICQAVADRVGLERPSAVLASTDKNVRQLLALANAEGASLATRHDWDALVDEHTFLTVAQAEQTNTPVPTDLRKFIPDSFYNRTTQRKVEGPITPQEWQLFQARSVLSTVYLTFRQRQGTFLMTPVPPANETIAYEYISTGWAQSSAGQGKTSFTSDDDTSFLSEELITLGMIWRFKQAKGIEYAEDMETYERALMTAAGEDGGSTALSMGGNYRGDLMNPSLPEGSFGL